MQLVNATLAWTAIAAASASGMTHGSSSQLTQLRDSGVNSASAGRHNSDGDLVTDGCSCWGDAGGAQAANARHLQLALVPGLDAVGGVEICPDHL